MLVKRGKFFGRGRVRGFGGRGGGEGVERESPRVGGRWRRGGELGRDVGRVSEEREARRDVEGII